MKWFFAAACFVGVLFGIYLVYVGGPEAVQADALAFPDILSTEGITLSAGSLLVLVMTVMFIVCIRQPSVRSKETIETTKKWQSEEAADQELQGPETKVFKTIVRREGVQAYEAPISFGDGTPPDRA